MLAVEASPLAPGRSVAATAAAAMVVVSVATLALLRGVSPYQGLMLAAVAAVAAAIVAIDIRSLRAPNALVYPAAAFLALASLPLGAHAFLDALSGGMAAFAVLLLVALAGRGAMGMGDVKAGAMLGLAVGIRALVPMLLVAFLAGGLFAALALGFRLRSRKDVVAFTPFLVAGAIVALALGDGYLVR